MAQGKHSHSKREQQGDRKKQTEPRFKPSKANIKSFSSCLPSMAPGSEMSVPEGWGGPITVALWVVAHMASLWGCLQSWPTAFLHRLSTFSRSLTSWALHWSLSITDSHFVYSEPPFLASETCLWNLHGSPLTPQLLPSELVNPASHRRCHGLQSVATITSLCWSMASVTSQCLDGWTKFQETHYLWSLSWAVVPGVCYQMKGLYFASPSLLWVGSCWFLKCPQCILYYYRVLGFVLIVPVSSAIHTSFGYSFTVLFSTKFKFFIVLCSVYWF